MRTDCRECTEPLLSAREAASGVCNSCGHAMERDEMLADLERDEIEAMSDDDYDDNGGDFGQYD